MGIINQGRYMGKKLAAYFRDTEGVHKKWSWFFALGILLVLLGLAVMGSAFQATVFSVLVFGILLLGSGIVQIVQAIFAKKWSGFFPSLILSILYIVTGFLCVANPAQAAMSLTFFLAAFCFFSGLVKMSVSVFMHFERWGFVFFNGLITFILGVLIYAEWPVSGLWVIGTFVGIDILLTGCSWIALSLAAKKR